MMHLERDSELKDLQDLFLLMDSDSSGTLSWAEFKHSFKDPRMAAKWMMLDFEPEECRELFNLLDDGDGEIETAEFFNGLRRMRGTASAKDVFRLQKLLAQVKAGVQSLRRELAAPAPPREKM